MGTLATVRPATMTPGQVAKAAASSTRSSATTCSIERCSTNDLPQEAKPRMTEPTVANVPSPARALIHAAPRRVEIREVPAPRPAAGEVLVRTLCSGISGGTERLVYRGEVPVDLAQDDTIDALGGTFSYPFAYGYSCVGEVESGRAVFAFHPHQDVFAARADDLIPMPAIDPASATLFPLVETALQVTLDAGTGYRDRVIVLGAGVLGLLTSLLMQRSGWRPLLAEPQAWRRAMASSLGATAAAPEELAAEKVPLVIDASGNPDAPAMALNMLAHEGTLLIASWFGTKPVVLPLGGAFHRRRLIIRSTQVSTVPARLSGTWTRSRRRRETVELLAELPLAPLCTHVFAFGHAAEAFRAVDEGIPGLMHAVLDYDRSTASDV
jgi:threonine dehydrogenase-like Zn-dependent dehydrogenase